jgi:hypothetical protein
MTPRRIWLDIACLIAAWLTVVAINSCLGL